RVCALFSPYTTLFRSRLRHRLQRRRLHPAGDAPAQRRLRGLRLRPEADAAAVREGLFDLPVPGEAGGRRQRGARGGQAPDRGRTQARPGAGAPAARRGGGRRRRRGGPTWAGLAATWATRGRSTRATTATAASVP